MENEGITKRIGNWFNGLKAELKRISWPAPITVAKQTGTIIVVAVILGVIIAVLDFIFQWGIDFIVNL